MIACNEPAQSTCVRLSQWDGSRVLALLDHLAVEDGGPCDASALKSAAEKLSDACSVAFWLRENVELDLSGGEALAVLQAIEANLKELDPPPPLVASLQGLRTNVRPRPRPR